MPDILAQTADGVTHSFPDGTPDDVIDKAIKGYASQQLTQQTQAAAPATKTKPFFEKPKVGTPFPSTNPIEAAGERQDRLGGLQQRAMRSPTPFSNASAILAPVTAARQIVGSKVGGYLGEKAAPLVGVSPEVGSVVGGVTGGVAAGAGPKAVDTIGDLSLEVPNKVKIPWTNIKINRNVPPTEAETMELRAKDLTRRQIEQDRLDKIAAKRTIEPATEKTISGPAPARTLRNPPWKVAPVKGGSGATSSSVIDSLPSKYGVSQAGVDAFKQGEASAAARAAPTVPIAPAAPTEAAPATITPPWKSRAARNAAQPQPTTITPPPAAEAPSATGKTPYREPTVPSSGIRPSMTEQYATFLAKKPIWSPAEEQFARRIWGEDANIRSGEGQSKYRARLLGMVRSGRAAVGMQDVESGPMQPPPEP